VIDPLRIGRVAESLGRGLVPFPQPPPSTRPRTPSYLDAVEVIGAHPLFGLERTREAAEATAWRAFQARREARSLGRVAGALLAVLTAAWLGRKERKQ
jgi:hypothetical protein